MDPNIWGPSAWTFLHTVTLNYPNNPTKTDINNYEKFFKSLQPILPCPKCSINYKKHFTKSPIRPHLKNKETLVKWLINIHNDVNKINNNKIWTYDEVINKYKDLYSKNIISKRTFYCIIIAIMIILILLYIYKYY